MLSNIHELSRVDLLHIQNNAGNWSYGCDQDWYTGRWQRQAGCGPNVASNMLMYLHLQNRIHLPFSYHDQQGSTQLMEAVWQFITPSIMGVHTVQHFSQGLEKFAKDHAIQMSCKTLDYPRNRKKRPPTSDVIGFIAAGLDADCPVAFLNLSSGDIKELDSWHWVTIVKLQIDETTEGYRAEAYDGDKTIWFDLQRWCETTAGGGFVRADL